MAQVLATALGGTSARRGRSKRVHRSGLVGDCKQQKAGAGGWLPQLTLDVNVHETRVLTFCKKFEIVETLSDGLWVVAKELRSSH